jgi:hypothetical protein
MGGKVLVLRTCAADMTSHGGFKWPTRGPVEAPDWNPQPVCGGGLHGALWGEGEGGLFNWNTDAKWLVVEVDKADIVDLNGKVKFPRGVVKHCGDRMSATAWLAKRAPGRAIIGAALTGGHWSTLTGGDESTLTGGDESTLTGGDRSTLTGGDGSTLTGGDGSTLTGGDESTLTGGDESTLTGGDESTLTGGDESTLTGGDESTLTGGDRSTLTGGDGSTLTGGDRSTLVIKWWDGTRYRLAVGYVGENGIRPNVAYKVSDRGEFVEAQP